MILTPDTLKRIMPRSPADLWAPALTAAMAEWRIDTPLRVAAFLAQMAHESSELTHLEESLNYSAERLMAVWPSRMTLDLAAHYARNSEKLANYIYGNRYGNGPEASGDGYRFRGRGPFQLTFRDNYRACGKALKADLEVEPERVLEPGTGARSAGWYWSFHGLNSLADKGDFKAVTKAINGGLIGLAERVAYYEKAKEALT